MLRSVSHPLENEPSRRKWSATEERRRQILQAALGCFTETGYAAATIDDIRVRSGASIGSIYHHFGGKEALAAALYVEGLREYHGGLLAKLSRRRTAEGLVKGLVEYHIDWVEQNPDWARYLIEMRRAESVKAAEADIRALNQKNFGALFALFEPFFQSGAVVNLPRGIFVSVVFGPAQEYARLWLKGRAHTPLSEARVMLAAAAWRAIQGSSPRS
jgi:AcrR family transcriptional regulator